MKIEEFQSRLLIFACLAKESEKWALCLKGNVNHEFAYRLNLYLKAADQLNRFVLKSFPDEETVDAVSETFSKVIEKLMSQPVEKRNYLIALMELYSKEETETISLENEQSIQDPSDPSQQEPATESL